MPCVWSSILGKELLPQLRPEPQTLTENQHSIVIRAKAAGKQKGLDHGLM